MLSFVLNQGSFPERFRKKNGNDRGHGGKKLFDRKQFPLSKDGG